MTIPKRIQRRRVKGWRMPEGAVCVDRTTRWGNPFRVGHTFHSAIFAGDPWTFPLVEDAAMATELYRKALELPDRAVFVMAIRSALRGKNLACWCALCAKHKDGKPLNERCADCSPCHVDPLGEIANDFRCEPVTRRMGGT